MVTTDLGACEWFVWDLRRSNLIDRGQLDQIVLEFLQKNPRAEPAALAEYLVGQSILTSFQAERLLQGKTQGFVLGPYTLMDALGAGSMGTVYKATNKTDNQAYAVKVLPRRSMWNVRIARRKVRAFEQARHPSVVPFVDVGTAGGMHYLAWPFVAGETLDKVIASQGKTKPSTAAHIALQIAEALEVCHQQGLIHGLLKPSNLMIGAQQQVFILDFGIGCLLAETEGESLVDTMSTSNSVTSGLDCASPESIMDPQNLTPQGDQYSLGCTLYYMLSGQFPFQDGSAAEKMMAHQFKEPTPLQELNPEVPAELIAIVQRLMKKTPQDRFNSCGELVETLRPLASAQTTPNRPNPARPQNGRDHTAIQAGKAQPAPDGLRSLAANGNGAAKPSVAPSLPTPKPAGLGTLPTRNSLRGANGAAPAPAPSHKPAEVIPANVPAAADADEPEPKKSLEEQLGTSGVVFIAVLACFLVFFLVRWFELF